MSARKDYLRGVFGRYLDRRSVPQHIAGNVEARTDEMAALMRAVFKAAPDQGYQEWWPRMEDAIDSIMRTRVWPTVNEIRASARLVQKNGFTSSQVVVKFDPASINLRRIRAGEAVGEEWLFGQSCILLLEKGATEDEFAPHRSALYFADKGLVGEEIARNREKLRRERHDISRELSGMPRYFNAPQVESAGVL